MFDNGSFLRRRRRFKKKELPANSTTKLTDALKSLERLAACRPRAEQPPNADAENKSLSLGLGLGQCRQGAAQTRGPPNSSRRHRAAGAAAAAAKCAAPSRGACARLRAQQPQPQPQLQLQPHQQRWPAAGQSSHLAAAPLAQIKREPADQQQQQQPASCA